MTSKAPDNPFVRSVFHPTDFSEASASAFAHALAIALARETSLTLLHAGADEKADNPWTGFPSVRATLERWGLLEPGSPREAVFEAFHMRVKKVALQGSNPLRAILAYLAQEPADLIVLATEGRDGLPRWIHGSLSEPLARKSQTMTLFVPRDCRPLVSLEDGSYQLERVLVPVDREPRPEAAVELATRAARFFGKGGAEIRLLHIGDGTQNPYVELGEDPAWRWNRIRRDGPVVDEIVGEAESTKTDLIVMGTAGHQGILDAFRGSTTEQVVRRAPCPVLAVPQDWYEELQRAGRI